MHVQIIAGFKKQTRWGEKTKRKRRKGEKRERKERKHFIQMLMSKEFSRRKTIRSFKIVLLFVSPVKS